MKNADDDPGRIESELAISGAWPLPRPERKKPKIGPSSDRHSGGAVWPLMLPAIVLCVWLLVEAVR